MATVGTRFLTGLFGTGSETVGRRWHVRAVEFTVVGSLLFFCANYASKLIALEAPPFPIMLGRYVPLDVLYVPAVAVGVASVAGVLLVAGAAGVRPGWTYGFALVGLHVLYAARHSFGKVSHGFTLVGAILIGFWLAAVVFSDDVERRRFAYGFAVFTVGLSYTLSAISKLVGSGVGWVEGSNLWLWVSGKTVERFAETGSEALYPLEALVLGSYPLATAMLTGALVLELLGLLFWWARARPFMAVGLAAMHLGISAVMQIHFTYYLLMLLVIGLPLGRWIDRIRMRCKRAQRDTSGDAPSLTVSRC